MTEMTLEEVREVFKKSIDTTDNMNQAIENLIQSVYLKGYNDALNNAPTIIEADKESGVVFKTICNSCVVCHKETIDPNPFYICDTCKEKLKADKGE